MDVVGVSRGYRREATALAGWTWWRLAGGWPAYVGLPSVPLAERRVVVLADRGEDSVVRYRGVTYQVASAALVEVRA